MKKKMKKIMNKRINFRLLISLLLTAAVLFSIPGCAVFKFAHSVGEGLLSGIGGGIISDIEGLLSVTQEPDPSTITEEETDPDEPLLLFIRKASWDFGYDYLSGLSHPERRKEFYDRLRGVCERFHGSIATAGYDLMCRTNRDFYESEVAGLKNSGLRVAGEIIAEGLTTEEAFETYSLFQLDNPVYYWLSDSSICYTMSSVDGVIFPVLCIEKYADPEERASMNMGIDTVINEMLLETESFSTEYGKALSVHRSIIKRIDYKTDADLENDTDAHSVAGFADGSGCVCDGYSKTFQIMMNLLGIESVCVYNLTHEWNLIKLEGYGWFWVDVTYDETEAGDCTLFFCKNDTEDIYTGTHYVGSGNFLENKHEIMKPGTSGTKDTEGYTYFELGIMIIPELPERSAVPYSGPTD